MNVRLNQILLAAALAAQPVSAQGPLAPSGAPAPIATASAIPRCRSPRAPDQSMAAKWVKRRIDRP